MRTREIEVCRCFYTSKDVAGKLGISEKKVEQPKIGKALHGFKFLGHWRFPRAYVDTMGKGLETLAKMEMQ